ncbi:hypothetical protein BJ944DRAFT_240780 [Cunninghamella echinulata]|nr:hypothetical protein BJ944DRAFT_240780 [Cunninghamella echinulata]
MKSSLIFKLNKQDISDHLYFRNLAPNRKPLWKTSSEWKQVDLDYFKIKIERVSNFKDFFNEDMPTYDDFNDQEKEFINCDQVIHANYSELREIDWSIKFKSPLARNVVKNILMVFRYSSDISVVDDLSCSLLKLFDYDTDDFVIHHYKDILQRTSIGQIFDLKVFIPNQSIETTRENYVKLVQENRCLFYSHSIFFAYGDQKKTNDKKEEKEEIKCVADTIAAFQNNYALYGSNKESSRFLRSQYIMPGIVMFGTRLRFLLIPMTADLLHAVEKGESPQKETIVKEYIIPPPEQTFTGREMQFRDQRLYIAACYKAFRKYVI